MPIVRVKSMQRNPNQGPVELMNLGPVELILRVDDADNPVVNSQVFGAMGDAHGDNYYPFAMYPDGTVDFGAYSDERNGRFNIMEKKIERGVDWTYTNIEFGESTYQITEINPE